MTSTLLWTLFGFFGQAMFSARFLWQWLQSERVGKSIIPVGFWYFSIAGGVTLFIYALYREDPVFSTGQAAGLVIYLRNLYFVRHNRAAT